VDELHVLDVLVHPDARRRAMGGALLDAALARARGLGHARVLLELRADNTAALGLYRGRGFVVVGRRTRYYPDGQDAILMTRTMDSDRSEASADAVPVRVDAPVLSNRSEGGDNHRLVLSLADWPGAVPGQFVMLSAGARTAVERSDPLLPRPMAVYRGHAPAADGAGRIEVLYKAIGRGTRLLAETLPGQSVRVVGPLGAGFPPVDRGRVAILVGGGTGIASLYELAARAAGDARVHVVLGARRRQDLMGVDDFEALDVELHPVTEDGSLGEKGLVTDVLAPLLARLSRDSPTVHACGPTPMMRACAALAEGAGSACIVSLENNMACGFGVCLGCAVPMAAGGFSLVCRQGPVYAAEAVRWEGLP
jgi:dihydroorotate dehydrogenase electron transfer subunit